MTEDKRQKLIRRLEKLKRQVDGEHKVGNIAAAESAAELFHELLVKYKIDASEIQEDERDDDAGVQERIFEWESFGFELRKRRNGFLEALAGTIVESYGARMLINQGASCFWIVSRESTYQILTYVLPMLRRAAEDLASTAYNAAYKESIETFDRDILIDFRKNFLLGFVRRLAVRFRELKERKRDAMETQALVLISDDLALADAFVNDGSYRSVQSPTLSARHNHRAYSEGTDAADSLNLEGADKEISG